MLANRKLSSKVRKMGYITLFLFFRNKAQILILFWFSTSVGLWAMKINRSDKVGTKSLVQISIDFSGSLFLLSSRSSIFYIVDWE